MAGKGDEPMLAQALGYGLRGVEGYPVQVEVFISNGLPSFDIVGLPDAAVKESKDRIRAALMNSGYHMPVSRVTVNLAPADIKKEGPGFDLPIAMALLQAAKQIPLIEKMEEVLLIGELSLKGELTPVKGVLPLAISAYNKGITRVMVPSKNAKEIECIEGIEVFPAETLTQVVDHLTFKNPIKPQLQKNYEAILHSKTYDHNLIHVRGQLAARRALEIAAAGGHNPLLIGVPGSGKTMLARCLPSILPEMAFEEALETTRLHSIVGSLPQDGGLMTNRPFRAPHHNASLAALIGGGATARPGEVSLAHNGVLFLDELPEFSRTTLEALRQPLEDGMVSITRVQAQSQYQSSCMLIASMNPCPCGFYGSKTKQCHCSPHEIRRYLDKISGPLLDRIDMQVEVDSVSISDIQPTGKEEDSKTVRERVQKARALQQKRYKEEKQFSNAQLAAAQVEKYCKLNEASQQLLEKAMERFGLSMRAYSRISKVARTIADLAGEENILVPHVAEAIQYRNLDGKYWR